MNAPIARFGKTYLFQRYQRNAQSFGQAQLPTEVTPGQLSMLAVVQPIKGFEVQNLPEGWRGKAGISVWTETPLQLADDETQVLGDRFIFNGYQYEIRFRADWSGTMLTHYKYYAFKTEVE